MGNPSFLGFSGFFIRVFSILFFTSNLFFVYAQDHVKRQNQDSASVIVINGGMIFSSDESFNQQILEKKVIITGSSISYTHGSDHKHLVISNSETIKSSDKTTIANIKYDQKQKAEKDLNDIKTHVAKYEAKKKNFQKEYIRIPLSSAHFTGVQNNSKNFITPTSFQYKVDKTDGRKFYFIIQNALDFLYNKHYTYYNSQPLQECYCIIFSVRPPPFFI